MGIRDLVNKFTSGELDPKFIAEVDYDGYRKAARKLRNVVCIPQGGAQKRFGLTYEHVIMDGANYVTDINKVRLIAYEHPVDQLFYLTFHQLCRNRHSLVVFSRRPTTDDH